MVNPREQEIKHALLVILGKFAQETGLISGIESVKLGQKSRDHTAQSTVLELLVGTLSDVKYLKYLSLSSHPLDKDMAVVQAWGQSSWADYSGVSRTMSKLSWVEARVLVAVLERVSAPFIESEMKLIQELHKVIEEDGDLTGIPVPNTSRTYPNAAYGHMDDEIRVGYQEGVTSLRSPTDGRLWLSVEHHAGDTVSCTEAEAFVLAAEKRTGLRPRRRTELLQDRIITFQKERQPTEKRLEGQKFTLEKDLASQLETPAQLQEARLTPETKPERIQSLERRTLRREQAVTAAQRRLEKTLRTGHLRPGSHDHFRRQLHPMGSRLDQASCQTRPGPTPDRKNGHQAPGSGVGEYFGKNHPKFRRYVVKVQSSQRAGW